MNIQTKKKVALLPYNQEKIRDKHLIVNMLGDWCILDKYEFNQLNRCDVFREGSLRKKLEAAGILVSDCNLAEKVNRYRYLNLSLFSEPYLHIAVLSERCNLTCRYCQTDKSQSNDMNIEVASKIIDFLSQNRANSPILEFQGGEPLLNWEVMKFLVERGSALKKVIKFYLVSNLLLMDKEKLDFLINHNVSIGTSLDGPEFVHNKNRIFADGRGSYKEVVAKIREVRKKYKKRGKGVGILPTITKHSLPYYREIIDEFIKQGQRAIAIRYPNCLGRGKSNWGIFGVTTKEFCKFWAQAVDYIIELNKRGEKISERMLCIIGSKVFNKLDPTYVDMANPCGAGRSVLTYTPSGDIYTCDEARMLGDDLFKVGNVLKDSYYEVMDSSVILDASKSSLLDIWDYKSPYKVWAGTCPVLNYAQQGSPVVKICDSRFHQIQKFQFRYFFDKILEDKENIKVFKSWLS